MEAENIVRRIFLSVPVHGPTTLGQGGLRSPPCWSVVEGARVALVALVHAHRLDVGAGAVGAADEAALGKPEARLTLWWEG